MTINEKNKVSKNVNSLLLNQRNRFNNEASKNNLRNNLNYNLETSNIQSNLLLNKNNKNLTTNIETERKLLFKYPPLPEIKFCFLIVICTLIYAWYCVYKASQKWLKFRLNENMPLKRLPFVGERFKDEINWEWHRWSPFALSYLPYLIIHSIIFNSAEKFFTEKYFIFLNIAFSIFTSIQMFSVKLVAFTILQGLFIFTCTFYTKRTIFVWLSSLPSLFLVMNHSTLLSSDIFHVLLFVSYTLLSYISFCLDWCVEKIRLEDKSLLQIMKRMFFYTFYQPYLFSLIVTYNDFEKQINERKILNKDFKAVIKRGIRVSIWWLILELMLHFFYFETMLHDIEFASQLPKNEFVTLGMALGSFFHMKYAVIFGLPAVFALLDGMQPPLGPICISRVALYSKIWRGFDRGLYSFFKTYIFLPICAPNFTIISRIIGVFVSYLFVLIWHGFHHQNIVWIALNIAELFIEFGAKGIYSILSVRKWRERNISDKNFRRLLGWAQIFPFAFGLYSNFYFLGGSQVGWLFVQRIFYEETVTLRWPFFLLITLGYFFMQVAMECERYFSNFNVSQFKNKI